MIDSNLERIEKELDAFMEWVAADDNSFVTRANFILFANHMKGVIKERDAAMAELKKYKQDDHRSMVAMIDAAMAEMSNIHPPMKRSECERLIRSALSAQPDQGRGACGDACKGKQCRFKEESPQDSPWRPMDEAPKDGTIVRLLVEFDDNATEDQPDPAPTIGCNNFDNDNEDDWTIAGWDWSQDCFTAGYGKPIGWLPMLDAKQAEVTP